MPQATQQAQANSGDPSSIGWICKTLQDSNAYTTTNALREWVTYGDLAALQQPGGIESIIATVKMEALYTDFSHVLGEALKKNDPNSVTCALIARAANAVPMSIVHQRQSVLIAFSSYCCDRGNAASSFSNLGLTPYMEQAVQLQYMM